MNRREILGIWLRAVMADDHTDLEDRIALGDILARYEVLPSHVWEIVDTQRLNAEQIDELAAAVHAVIRRNNPIAEAYTNWAQFHGLTLKGE